MNWTVVPWMYTIKLLLHRMKVIPTLVRQSPSLSPPCSSAQVEFDRPLSVCMRRRASFWAKHLFGASLRCFKATLVFQLSWRCQCCINWSSPKVWSHLRCLQNQQGAAPTPRSQAGRRGPWLCPICQIPGQRGQTCQWSRPSLPATLCRWVSQVTNLPTGMAALHWQGLQSSRCRYRQQGQGLSWERK